MRRQPLPSRAMSNPRVRARSCAVSESYIGPIGFDGAANAGSSAATIVCVTSTATRRLGSA